jgi:hypothetical protein
MDSVPHPTLDEILSLLDEMATHQRGKVLAAARRIIPHLTADDVLNPHDFPELESAGEFHYEDGILAGLLAAQAAIRARQGQSR